MKLSITAISKIWAVSLFEAAKERNLVESVREELEELASAIKASPEACRLFSEYGFQSSEQNRVMVQILSKSEFSSLVKRFCSLLIEKNRISIISEILSDYLILIDEDQCIVQGTVVAVTEEDKMIREQMEKKLEKEIGKKVVLNWKTDKKIIGGVVIKVAGKTFDNSIKTQLTRMRKTLGGEQS